MQLPGDGVGPAKAGPTCDIGGGTKRTSTPPKRISAPSRRPPPAIANPPAPPGRGTVARGAHTKGGAVAEGSQGGAGSGRPRFPSPPRPPATTPLSRARLPTPRCPHAPHACGLGSGGGSGRKRGPGRCTRLGWRGLPGSLGGSTGNQTRAGPALPAAPQRSVPEKVGPPGRAGAGVARGAAGGVRAGAGGSAGRVLPSSRHALPLPVGRWGRRAGGRGRDPAAAAAGPARRRDWGAGGGECEARAAS